MAPVTTDLEKFRLELGDTDGTLFTDDQATYLINERGGTILLAVADACEILARRYAKEFDFTANGEKSFKRSQKAEAYPKMATELRTRAGGGIGTLTLTKVDGTSSDLSTRDGAGATDDRGHQRHGYYDGDLPR